MLLLGFILKLNTIRTLKILGMDPKSTKLFYKRTPKQIVTCFVDILLVFASLKSTMEKVEHCMKYVKNKDTKMTSITL